MSPAETAAVLWHHATETPNEQLADAMDAGAEAIDAVAALRPWFVSIEDGSEFTASATDDERAAARRLLAVIGGES